MRYVALVRGIGPGHPNMRGEKFKAVFESLGFSRVHPVIASGNIVFDATSKKREALEAKIEKALHSQLGFKRAVIVRSKEDLEKLIQKNPFKGIKDEKPNYLLVTFFKSGTKELCSVIKLTEGKTPNFMVNLERQHGKDITSRTWKTVHRIVAKMQ